MKNCVPADLPAYFPVLFPVFFVAMWFVVTIILGNISGWYALMKKYPDRDEQPLLKLNYLSGRMGRGVRLSSILTLSACPSGLRVGISRIFGPWCRPFFVPWQDIAVTRKTWFFMQMAELNFGGTGKLMIYKHAADRLASASAGHWPEAGTFTPETRQQAAVSLFKQWLAITALASAFVTIVPMIAEPSGSWPPMAVAILFPAIVFGIATIIRYFVRTQ